METDFNIARMKALLEIADLVKLTVKATLIEMGQQKATVTQSFLFKKYGRRKVEKLIELGLLRPNKTGLSKNSSVEFDALEVEALMMPENRSMYIAQVREQEQLTKTP